MQKNIEVEGAKVLLETPEGETDTVVVLIPGVSGEARGARYAALVPVAHARGYAIARVDMWDSQEALHELTLMELCNTLRMVCDALVTEGFTKCILVGKSFGGGLALTCEHDAVAQKIAWAPALSCGGEEGNLGEKESVALGTIEKTTDIEVGKALLRTIVVPVGIVHGTADDRIPLQNSRDIIATVPHGTLIEVEGADHSFKTPKAEAELMAATAQLLV